MEDKTIGLITSPTLDIEYYIRHIISFFVDHFPSIVSGTDITLKGIIGIIVAISIPVSLILFIGIIYSVERIKSIRKKESKIYDAKVDMGYGEMHEVKKEATARWEHVIRHIESHSENDWRQAIIEADIMLDDLLSKMGYKGETVGDKLKRVAKGDMLNINNAWEAHKVRNRIAHDGSEFGINQNEARQIINFYKAVFQEFSYI